MLTRAYLSLLLLVGMPAWCQVAPAATGGTDIPDDALRMPIPPMVGSQAYPTTTRNEERSNYLDAGLTFEPAYYANILPDYGAQPINTMGYSITPSIELDQLTPRLHQAWTYLPGVTVYQQTSAQNEEDQNASLDIQYRLSQHMTISGMDRFQKASNVFNQPYSLSGEPITGSPPASPADIIFPFADRITNAANAEITYQFSMNGMIGAGGSTTMYNYLNLAQFPGLYDSNSRGGSAFYSRRMYGEQFIGVTYQYVETLGYPLNAQLEIQTNTVYPFYSILLEHRFYLSLAGGPQRYDLAESGLPASSAWTPAVMGSLAWQRYRTNIVAMYSRSTTGAGGLFGVFHANTASGSANWQLAKTWSVGLGANYALYKNVSPLSALLGLTSPGGRSVSEVVSINHSLSEHFRTKLEYERLDESYIGIAAISNDPVSDRGSISISYQFTRPLGR